MMGSVDFVIAFTERAPDGSDQRRTSQGMGSEACSKGGRRCIGTTEGDVTWTSPSS